MKRLFALVVLVVFLTVAITSVLGAVYIFLNGGTLNYERSEKPPEQSKVAQLKPAPKPVKPEPTVEASKLPATTQDKAESIERAEQPEQKPAAGKINKGAWEKGDKKQVCISQVDDGLTFLRKQYELNPQNFDDHPEYRLSANRRAGDEILVYASLYSGSSDKIRKLYKGLIPMGGWASQSYYTKITHEKPLKIPENTGDIVQLKWTYQQQIYNGRRLAENKQQHQMELVLENKGEEIFVSGGCEFRVYRMLWKSKSTSKDKQGNDKVRETTREYLYSPDHYQVVASKSYELVEIKPLELTAMGYIEEETNDPTPDNVKSDEVCKQQFQYLEEGNIYKTEYKQDDKKGTGFLKLSGGKISSSSKNDFLKNYITYSVSNFRFLGSDHHHKGKVAKTTIHPNININTLGAGVVEYVRAIPNIGSQVHQIMKGERVDKYFSGCKISVIAFYEKRKSEYSYKILYYSPYYNLVISERSPQGRVYKEFVRIERF